MNQDTIHIKGARVHNLKDVELRLPRGKLVVVTGVSGSGKSSLAFDTLYAEGYRKYMDSLSTKARSVLDQVSRPDVDYIHGLSPVIAIEQRSAAGANPRSTVATVTEIADYARLLWTVHGVPHCPKDGGLIARRSMDDCIARIYQEPEGARMMILAHIMEAKPSVLRDELPRIQQRGFQRIRVAGEVKLLDECDAIPRVKDALALDIVVDRVAAKDDQRSRIADSLELAFREGNDRAIILVQDREVDGGWREFSVSQHFACNTCGTVYDPVTPRSFSYNHPAGACESCGGLGKTMQFAPELIVPDPSLPVKKGAIKPWRLGSKRMIIQHNAILKQLAEQLPFDANCPWQDLPVEVREQILYGCGERQFSFKLKPGNTKPELRSFPGMLEELETMRRETSSDGLKAKLMAYQVSQHCQACNGKRLRPESLCVTLADESFPGFMGKTVDEALTFTREAGSRLTSQSTPGRGTRGGGTNKMDDVTDGLEARLRFLSKVGLGFLQLNRAYATLSGGEAQRVRLATQLGMGLVGVTYVLDEPSIGLHPVDNERLIKLLQELRDRGNTVVVVEHDGEMMRAADWLVEMGPGAGDAGGRLIFEGTLDAMLKDKQTLSGKYLSGERRVESDFKTKLPGKASIHIKDVQEHNLRGFDVAFPVGCMTCVTGVSGSGKSTLVNDILGKAAARHFYRSKDIPGKHGGVSGWEYIENVVRVDQSPIGKSPRSNPATYTRLFDELRKLYAMTPLAKVRGYSAGRFSFNTSGGRCERCAGDGQIKLDMQFLADVYSECPSCQGQRYNRETLEIRYKGHSIAQALEMTVDEALEVFRAVPKIASKLETLRAVGLGYVQLGQSANTLSGGEAQRIKLSLELSKRQQGGTLYLLDEPTTGLHWADIQKLMNLLFQLRDQGNTIIIIEHDTDVIRLADHIIDLGPGGGSAGGSLVYAGDVRGLMASEESVTGQALEKVNHQL